MAMRTHRPVWCVRIGSRFGLQAFLCNLLVPRALFSHFRSELFLLKPETLERTHQGIEIQEEKQENLKNLRKKKEEETHTFEHEPPSLGVEKSPWSAKGPCLGVEKLKATHA
ncbi:hypothetical protein PIB30_068379 [Stylosanthes scabra]|uniref:Uncharacterized protein n=1 Tax=Stylosanthes scabra TaxID=79078 RepID=A0ABU6RND0_9FABA|nr:hypothetical protein [Stylosanthes scabra]